MECDYFFLHFKRYLADFSILLVRQCGDRAAALCVRGAAAADDAVGEAAEQGLPDRSGVRRDGEAIVSNRGEA